VAAKLRVGIIGCGILGTNHSRFFSRHKNTTVVAVADGQPLHPRDRPMHGYDPLARVDHDHHLGPVRQPHRHLVLDFGVEIGCRDDLDRHIGRARAVVPEDARAYRSRRRKTSIAPPTAAAR
jgi:hypothetical protein